MRSFFGASLLGLAAWACAQTGTIPGITFAAQPGMVFVVGRQVATELGMEIRFEKNLLFLGETSLETERALLDGTRLVAVRKLEKLGATVEADPTGATIRLGEKEFRVQIGEKRVEINRSRQTLRAYQGEFLVAESRVSTGRRGFTTPLGDFTAGPEKSRYRVSRKYANAPMPYSVQIRGGVFMHGSASVPSYPASHGCVRLPLSSPNTAQWIWQWIELGTPIRIALDWSTPDTRVAKPEKQTVPIGVRGG